MCCMAISTPAFATDRRDSGQPDRAHRGPGPYAGAWRRFHRHLPAMIGLLILVGLGLAALAAPLLTPYDPVRQQLPQALQPPSLAHPLGTDHLGRDLLARLLYGG